MPTLLELFKTKVLDSSGNTAEVDFDVKDYKKLNPISSSDPLLNQTGVRAVNLARKNFSERLSETLLETELSGTRVYRAASEGVLYGTELVRISRRTTKILTDMKTATINEGGQVAPLITGTLGRTPLGGAVNNFFANNPNGIVGGLLDRAERAGTQLLNRIGINLPTVMIPTRISLNDKFRKGSEPNTMITLSEIKEDSNGNIAGRVLNRVIDGTPRQIVRNAINEGMSAVRRGIRTALFGARKQGAQNLASNPALYFSYSSEDKYSDTVDEQIDDIKLRNDLSTVAYGGDVEGQLFADYNKIVGNIESLQNQIIPLNLGGGSLGVESLASSENTLLNGGVAEEILSLNGNLSSKKRDIDRVRRLSNNSRFQAQKNLADRIKDKKPNKYNNESGYSETIDSSNEVVSLRNDLSDLLDSKTQALIDGSTPGNPRSKENLDKLAEVGYSVPAGVGSDKANLYSEEFGTYSDGMQWWSTEESERSDLSTELLKRRDKISNDDYSDYAKVNNFPGSIEFPLFPNKNNREKYFNDGKTNLSYTKVNSSEIGEQPIGGVQPISTLEAFYPGNIELKLKGGGVLKKSQLPYDGFDTQFNKALDKYSSLALSQGTFLDDRFDTQFNKALDKYSSLALSQGTFLAPSVGGGTPKLITSNALGINPKSDGINLLRNGVESDNDFVLLKFDKTQFRATITGLTETFSPSWDSGKFIGNAYNYYTYGGIERSVSFNFKVFSLSCEEHNNVWNKIDALSKKVYPKGYAGYGIKAPIIDFTLTDLYNTRKAFIESLSYTIDDNSPWYISDEKGKMTLPMIVDVQINLKFIEYTGSESDLYDFNNEVCAVVRRPSNEEILKKSGTTDTTTNRTNNDSNIEAIRNNQNDISEIETIDFESEDGDEEIPLIPQTPISLQPRTIAPIPQPTPTAPTINRQLPIGESSQQTNVRPNVSSTSLEPKTLAPIPQPELGEPTINRQLPIGESSQQTNVRPNVSSTSLEPKTLAPIPQPELGEPTINRQLPGLTKTTPTTTDLGEEIQQDNNMTPPITTNESGNIDNNSQNNSVNLSEQQKQALSTQTAYSNNTSTSSESITTSSQTSTIAKEKSEENRSNSEKRRIQGVAIYDTHGRYVSIDVEGDGNIQKVAKKDLRAWEAKNNIKLTPSRGENWQDLYR
jgi:hypothetical protein